MSAWRGVRRIVAAIARRPPGREFLIFLAFCLMTALMTWPWVLHLRDAVADVGDPYMIAWSLWWDFHQTFHDPFHLFNANIFYPYKYTLAFSENDYGIALVFFPLFAAGVRTLTIHSIATFLGFAFCGYGAFRLARTLTGSQGAAWVAGFVFAFIPFRFHMLSHLHYLFAGWIPLLLESLVLFARARSWRRAVWLGAAFLMNALTCISWFVLTLAPLAITAAYLLARSPALRRDHNFWLRAGVSLGVASLALIPFLLPYYWVSVMYGLKWQEWEFAFNSPTLMSWLGAERRVKLWEHMGEAIPGGHKLFPGLLAPLLAITALRFRPTSHTNGQVSRRERLLIASLDVAVILAGVVAVIALGYKDIKFSVFGHQIVRLGAQSVTQASVVIVLLLTFRLGFTFRETVRRVARRKFFPERTEDDFGGEAFIIALIWTIWGFLASLGANFFLNRILHDYVLLYKSIRFPSRSAMICYVGLAVLAGMGAARLARLSARARPRAYVPALAVLMIALSFELRAFPLKFDRGAVEPDSISLRLKETPMKGGLVELPSDGCCSRHRYMLRAADHGRPLVNATASFISPLTDEINKYSETSPLSIGLLDLLESIPASYLVIHNADVPLNRRADYEMFIARSIVTGRLRFINRFDGRDDLYAVVKTEPDARSEAALPFRLSIKEWAAQIEDDPVNILGQYLEWSQTLFRMHLAATGSMPRYADFVGDARALGRGVLQDYDGQERKLENNLRSLAEDFTTRPAFKQTYGALDDAQYVDRLIANAGVDIGAADRNALVAALASREESRAGVLLKIAADPRFALKEQNRSLVALHYFGYFRRNPGDAPDRGLEGLEFWIRDLETNHAPGKLSAAFKDSIEYGEIKAGREK